MKLQEKMFALILSWYESGMVRSEFLSDQAISLSKFNYWLSKYQKAQGHSSLLPAPLAGDFKSFVVSEGLGEGCHQAVSMELTTPSGVRVVIYK